MGWQDGTECWRESPHREADSCVAGIWPTSAPGEAVLGTHWCLDRHLSDPSTPYRFKAGRLGILVTIEFRASDGGGRCRGAIELALTGQDDTDTSLGKLLSLFDKCGLRAQTGSGGYTNVSSRVGVLYLAWSVVTVLDFRIWAG